MCELGKPTVIRWEVDSRVIGPHNMTAVWCNGDCIQTPQGQESQLRPAVPRGLGQHMHGDWIVDNDKCPHPRCHYFSPESGDPSRP